MLELLAEIRVGLWTICARLKSWHRFIKFEHSEEVCLSVIESLFHTISGKLKSPNKNNGALGYRTISWLRASCRSLQKEGEVVGGL